MRRQEEQDGGCRPRGARRNGTGIGRGDQGRTGSGSWSGVREQDPAGTRTFSESQYWHGREEGTPPASGLHVALHVEHEHSIPHPCARYPLNSKRLTAWHLRALAQALELPTTGSPDLLRQCIEAAVDQDHGHQNVVVTVKESLKTECIVALADLDGEFLASEPVYRDAHRVRFEEDVQSAGELHAIRQQLEEAHHQLEVAAAREEKLQGTLEECELQATETCDSLRTQLATEKEKARTSWRTSCEHLEQQDIVITAQDRKIASLRGRIAELEAASNELMKAPSQKVQSSEQVGTVTTSVTAQSYPRQVGRSLLPPTTSHSVRSSLQDGPPRPDTTLEGTTRGPDASLGSEASAETIAQSTAMNTQRRGRAPPPIEFFTGEDPSITVDDWLPSLERASDWNSWTATEKLMQLPGHLKGRALQEWRLLEQTVQQDYRTAIEALRSRLDPGSKTMAVQDFRHSIQRSGESVPDYIRHLEKTYQIAYGKDDLNSATQDALLYGQLYEGL